MKTHGNGLEIGATVEERENLFIAANKWCDNWGEWWGGILAVLHYMSQYSFCWDLVGMDIKDLESVGMDPNRSAPLRASTSPPPPLAYFQHIELSVPKRKI